MQRLTSQPPEFIEVREASGTDGGTAISTTAIAPIQIPFGSDWAGLWTRNFSVDCNVVKLLLNPFLTIVKADDAGATTTNTTDISNEAQDGDSTDILFDDWPAAGRLFIGSPIPIRGFYVTLGSEPNGDASTGAGDYLRGPMGGWGSLSITDGTDNGNNHLEQSGAVTWTVPSAGAWQKTSLIESGDITLTAKQAPWATRNLYWMRYYADTAVDVSTDVAQISSLGRSTNYMQLGEGQTFNTSVRGTTRGFGIGSVEALTDAGTANLVVNVGMVAKTGMINSRERFD